MENLNTVTEKLFKIASDIDKVNTAIIRLEMHRDGLLEQQKKLRALKNKIECRQDLHNAYIGHKMTIDLLESEVGRLD